MSEALIALVGVLLGGLISIAVQCINSYFENSRWKKEKIIENLTIKREKLEKKFEDSFSKIKDGVADNSFDVEMVFEIMHVFPKNIDEAFDVMMKEVDANGKIKKEKVWDVAAEMKKTLALIDKEIQIEINR